MNRIRGLFTPEDEPTNTPPTGSTPVTPPSTPANGNGTKAATRVSLSDDQVLRLEQRLSAPITELLQAMQLVERQVTRSSKEQLRATALAETALAEARHAVAVTKAALERLESVPERPTPIVASLPTAAAHSDLRLIEALMPILDGIEAALDNGGTQAEQLSDRKAREILQGWLDGQRLLRDRLLALFKKEGVRPIPTLGQTFDPHRHVAVESIYDGAHPTGTIVEERRRGYQTDHRVIRFAEVVVTRTPADDMRPSLRQEGKGG